MERVPIEFEGYRINSIDYSIYEEGLSEDKDKGKLQVKSLLTEDRKNAQLIIKTTVNDENNNRKLIIELSGFFNKFFICLPVKISELSIPNFTPSILFKFATR